jgi:signal transduction histidine kinase
MGLGLAICRTIVEGHGGELRVAKTDSRGTSFELILPIGSPIEQLSSGDEGFHSKQDDAI